MDKMTERVAKVLADANLDGCETTMDGGDIRACVGPCLCRDTARRAVEVMREPTKAMVITGDNHTNCGGSCDNRAGWHAWVSMIDAILKE